MQVEKVELPEPMGMTQPNTTGINTTCPDGQEEARRVLQRKTICRTWVGYSCMVVLMSVTGTAGW